MTSSSRSEHDQHMTSLPPPDALLCSSPRAAVTDHSHALLLQVMHTSQYTQWTGFIDQTALGLDPTDYGGELDPHG